MERVGRMARAPALAPLPRSSASSRCATGSSRGGGSSSASRTRRPRSRRARESGAEELALLGFSMGGAVAVRNAAADGVELVAGVNPWLPPQLELETLRGRRLAIVHGALDAPLPLIPGVKPSMSLAAAERARALGIEVEREVVSRENKNKKLRGRASVVPFGFHAVALRRRDGGMLALPGRRALRRRSSATSWSASARRAVPRDSPRHPRRGAAALPGRDRRLRPARAGDRRREPRVVARPAAARPRRALAAALPRQGRALALPAGRLADGRARRDPDPPRPPRPALGRPRGGAAPRRRERRDLPAGDRAGRSPGRAARPGSPSPPARRSCPSGSSARSGRSRRARSASRRSGSIVGEPIPVEQAKPTRRGGEGADRRAREAGRRSPLAGPYAVTDATRTSARIRLRGPAGAARRSGRPPCLPAPDRRPLPPLPAPPRRRPRR